MGSTRTVRCPVMTRSGRAMTGLSQSIRIQSSSLIFLTFLFFSFNTFFSETSGGKHVPRWEKSSYHECLCDPVSERYSPTSEIFSVNLLFAVRFLLTSNQRLLMRCYFLYSCFQKIMCNFFFYGLSSKVRTGTYRQLFHPEQVFRSFFHFFNFHFFLWTFYEPFMNIH